MDANGNIIPIVEGDQGEGFMNEIDPLEFLNEQSSEVAQDKFKELVKQEFTGKTLESQPQPQAQPRQMQIQKGMVIHFYGYSYKCTAARLNGKVTLKLKGLWKGGEPK